jgi:hypothetical protein
MALQPDKLGSCLFVELMSCMTMTCMKPPAARANDNKIHAKGYNSLTTKSKKQEADIQYPDKMIRYL